MTKLLALPSQRQLVDRLLHQIEFNRPFLFICGHPGSGRATICTALREKLTGEHQLIWLCGKANMTMVEVRQQLLAQLSSAAVFNPHDALSDSVFRLLVNSSASLVWLIERADLLPAPLLAELWAISCQNEALAKPHQLAIVVSGDASWGQQTLPLLKGRAMPALELEVMPLSPPEQRIFLYEKAKQLVIPSSLLPLTKVDEILATANGHPSTIMQSLEDIMTDRRPKKRQEEFPVKKVAIFMGILAGGVLAASYLAPLLSGSKTEDNAIKQPVALPAPISSAVTTAGVSAAASALQGVSGAQASTPSMAVATQASSSAVNTAANAANHSVIAGAVSGAVSAPSHSASAANGLPNAIANKPLTTGENNYQGQRVEIPAAQVEKVLDKEGYKATESAPAANEPIAPLDLAKVAAVKATAQNKNHNPSIVKPKVSHSEASKVASQASVASAVKPETKREATSSRAEVSASASQSVAKRNALEKKASDSKARLNTKVAPASTDKVSSKPLEKSASAKIASVNASATDQKNTATSGKTAPGQLGALQAKKPNHYSIQLLGSGQRQSVEQFMVQHKLKGQAWIYETRFRGKPWYVVLKGEYSSLEQARQGIKALPTELQKTQPWAKPFSQVQKELKP